MAKIAKTKTIVADGRRQTADGRRLYLRSIEVVVTTISVKPAK